MTAEIAVMNKNGIALAADSKVTVTSAGVTKTYDTVSKLFTLSKCAPVGVMIYGNAEFMGFPWETIIKMYRRQKALQTEKRVVDWAADFFKYVRSIKPITNNHIENNVHNMLLSIITEVRSGFEHYAFNLGLTHESDDYERQFSHGVLNRMAAIAAEPSWLTDRQERALVEKYAATISQIIEQVLKDFGQEARENAAMMLVHHLVRNVPSPQVSGIVIAGYGDDEYFPTLVEYHIEGYVGRHLKCWLQPPVTDISRHDPACIRPFAQKEMVQRFMEGIDPYYSQYLSGGIAELVMENCFDTLQKYGTKTNKTEAAKSHIRDAVVKAVQQFEEEAQAHRWERFSDPVVKMVAVLPKDELAHLAESLVALTSLKRRVSSDAETVGGPVDVALITKGDGFIWIKRKHYFSEEINPQFIRNYMNDVNGHMGDNDDGHDQKPRLRRAGAARAAPSSKPAAKA